MSAIKGNKSDSGAQKRKRKKTEDKLVESQKGSILKHLKKDILGLAVDDNVNTVNQTNDEETGNREIGHRPVVALDPLILFPVHRRSQMQTAQ